MERRKMAGLEELKRRVNVMEEAVGRGGGLTRAAGDVPN
jgi:hypothetical protein